MSGFDVLGPIPGAGAGAKPLGLQKPYGGDKLFPGRDGAGKVDGEVDGEPFIESLNDALAEVRGLQLESRDKARGLATGEPVQVHDLMISMGKSEVAFNLMLEVRNKLLEAWQTLQRSVS